jgi:hypothetical protein
VARRLYVYYRVPEALLAATLAQVLAMQAALRAAHPALQAAVLRRPDPRDGEVTLMETYAGLHAATLHAALLAASAPLPQPRHAEWFDELG